VATFSVVALYLAGGTRLGPGWRLAIRILVMLAMPAVGLARVVLGAHWPADILVGFALGAACAAAWWDGSVERRRTAEHRSGGRSVITIVDPAHR
jgi:membrane-associated phospholipid phosphatase